MEETKFTPIDAQMMNTLKAIALYFTSRGIRISVEADSWRVDGHKVLVECMDNLDGFIDAPDYAELDKWGCNCWEDGNISYRIKAKEVA